MRRQLPALVLLAVASAACSDLSTAPDRTPAELRVVPDTLWLTAGESSTFQVQVLDQDGEPYGAIPSWSAPAWFSSVPDVIEVDATGVTRGLQPGQSHARVEVAGMSTGGVVRVNPTEIGVTVPFVHVTQSVQRRLGDVPLVGGRDGLLRVYVRGDGLNFFRPTARATFYHEGSAVYEAQLTLEGAGLPEVVNDIDLTLSYDLEVPGWVLRPGVRLVVEVDPDGVLPAVAGSVLRVPEAGSLPLDVVAVPPFRLRMVPVTQSANGRTSRLTPSYADAVTRLTNDLFPFGEFDVDVREPYVTNAGLSTDEGWYQLIDEIVLLRWDDGSARYYYGGFDRPPGTNIGGLGYVGYPVAIGMDDQPDIIAHEIGHTLSLPHAPCGDPAGVDDAYPYSGGRTGQVGYDRSSGALQPPTRYDLMSYCDPIWISDYNYRNVLDYRATSEFDPPAAVGMTSSARAPEESVLVVRGGVRDGELRLEPALEWTGPVTLPERGGRYRVEGLDAAGATIFSVSFEPQQLDHGGDAQFLMALPLAVAAPDRLARLRLRGPEGVVERTRTGRSLPARPELRVERGSPWAPSATGEAVARWDVGAFPLAVVRNRVTGAIRGMSRTGEIEIPQGGDMEVLLSDGLGTRPATLVRR